MMQLTLIIWMLYGGESGDILQHKAIVSLPMRGEKKIFLDACTMRYGEFWKIGVIDSTLESTRSFRIRKRFCPLPKMHTRHCTEGIICRSNKDL